MSDACHQHSIPISAEMLRLVSEIDEFKGHWRTWQLLTPDRLQGLHRVANIEGIGSSTRIEGSRLTDREVEALLGRLETKSFATRDEQEVAGYAFVMEQVFAHASEIPLTANMLKQFHRDLRAWPGDRGAWLAAAPQAAAPSSTAGPRRIWWPPLAARRQKDFRSLSLARRRLAGFDDVLQLPPLFRTQVDAVFLGHAALLPPAALIFTPQLGCSEPLDPIIKGASGNLIFPGRSFKSTIDAPSKGA